MLDPITTKVLKEMLPEVIDPLLNIINSSLSLGYVLKTFRLAVIKVGKKSNLTNLLFVCNNVVFIINVLSVHFIIFF